jgi:hypothetical protein
VYEFHGWINIRASDPDEGDFAEAQAAIVAIRAHLARACEEIRGWFEIRDTFNGQIVVVTHGLRNHRQEGPPELFRWIGERYPLSYGLLYVHDDEDLSRGNEFVVHRLAHGKLTEFADTVLSPFVPTVEYAYDPEGLRGRTSGK